MLGSLVIFAIIVLTSSIFIQTVPKTGVLTSSACFENGVCLNLEIADSPQERAQGLMFRDNLASDSGMLFIFETDSDYAFWMKNTKIPLDIIWLDSDYRIVGIRENVAPCVADPCTMYSVGVPARMVLETNAGIVQQNNVRSSQKVQIQN